MIAVVSSCVGGYRLSPYIDGSSLLSIAQVSPYSAMISFEIVPSLDAHFNTKNKSKIAKSCILPI